MSGELRMTQAFHHGRVRTVFTGHDADGNTVRFDEDPAALRASLEAQVADVTQAVAVQAMYDGLLRQGFDPGDAETIAGGLLPAPLTVATSPPALRSVG